MHFATQLLFEPIKTPFVLFFINSLSFRLPTNNTLCTYGSVDCLQNAVLLFKFAYVTYKNTVARIVICRQDGRGRFPVYGASSPTIGQLTQKFQQSYNCYMFFTWDEYLQTIQWTNLTITNTFDTKTVHHAVSRTGLASEMHLICIEMHEYIQFVHDGPCTRPSGTNWLRKKKKKKQTIAQKMLRLLLLPGMSDQSLYIGLRIFADLACLC